MTHDISIQGVLYECLILVVRTRSTRIRRLLLMFFIFIVCVLRNAGWWGLLGGEGRIRFDSLIDNYFIPILYIGVFVFLFLIFAQLFITFERGIRNMVVRMFVESGGWDCGGRIWLLNG